MLTHLLLGGIMRFLVLLIFFTSSALASQQDHTCQGGHNCNDGGDSPVSVDIDVRSDSGSSAEASQNQSLVAGDANAEGGDATSEATGGNAETGPVSVTTEINHPRARKNTPNAYAPPIYPTVPCRGGTSGSAAGPGFGISIGTGRIDPGCVERENVRLAPTEAHRIRAWCNLKGVSDDWESLEACIGYGAVVVLASAGDDEEYKKVVARLMAIEAELKAEREARKETEKRIQQTEQQARRARSTREYPENEALRKLLENKNDP